MHTFRRLNVTWRQEVGATPLEAQKAEGHASLDMTFLYTQTDEAREREHVARILDRLKPAAETPHGSAQLASMQSEAESNDRSESAQWPAHGTGVFDQQS